MCIPCNATTIDYIASLGAFSTLASTSDQQSSSSHRMRQSALTNHFNARKPSTTSGPNDVVEVIRRTSSTTSTIIPSKQHQSAVSNVQKMQPPSVPTRAPLAVIHNNVNTNNTNSNNAVAMPPPSLPLSKGKGPPLPTPAPVRPVANLFSWQPRVNAIDVIPYYHPAIGQIIHYICMCMR